MTVTTPVAIVIVLCWLAGILHLFKLEKKYKAEPETHLTNALKWEQPEFTNLTIGASDSGSIVINLKTGKVTLPPGVSNDEAAREFWEAVERSYPGVIKRHERP